MDTSTKLLGAAETIAAVFPSKSSGPSLRAFRQWQANGWIPYHKIGRRTFFDPLEVRRALDRRFKVEPKPAH